MLQAIISPAKKMRIDPDAWDLLPCSSDETRAEPSACSASSAPAPSRASSPSRAFLPPFPEKSQALLAQLRSMNRDELQTLWKTSDKLTDEAIAALGLLEVPESAEEASAPRFSRRLTPAIFSYDGIQYTSLAPGVLDAGALAWLEEHLWVVSGFYGCVRPFSSVMPYRLEMGAALEMPAAARPATTEAAAARSRNLYEFWGADIAQRICREAENRPEGPGCIVNLASVEYAKAVLPHLPENARAVTCIFGEQLRNGRPVQRATASKIARGSMLRWMAENHVEDPAELPRFSTGYTFAPELTSTDKRGNETLVFMRS